MINLSPDYSDGENIDFKELTSKPIQISVDDEEVNAKYERGEIRIVTEQARYPLPTIPTLLSSGKYDLNPEFQRRHRWNNLKRSKLIESFIMNVPIPPIFLYEVTYSKYEVMDGLQRLTAINLFYNDEFELTGLTEWKELNGKKYSTLPEKIRLGIDRRYVSSIILLQETAKSEIHAQIMKQMVFERINSGGVDLSYQESRNAIYDGAMNRLCISLSENKVFKKIWNIPHDEANNLFDFDNTYIEKELETNSLYSCMEDVELVLRFFAFRHLSNYKLSLKLFLDYFLKESNLFSTDTLNYLALTFENTISFAYELFEDKSFLYVRKNQKGEWNWYNRPSKLVYDPMMFILSCNLENKRLFLDKKEEINHKIFNLFVENNVLFNGRNNNKIDIEKRIELFEKFFNEIIYES